MNFQNVIDNGVVHIAGSSGERTICGKKLPGKMSSTTKEPTCDECIRIMSGFAEGWNPFDRFSDVDPAERINR